MGVKGLIEKERLRLANSGGNESDIRHPSRVAEYYSTGRNSLGTSGHKFLAPRDTLTANLREELN